jgi:hypothetical protein
MERITGSEALGLFEAYSAVYAPQELTEEQVWEEVETWVNSLIEEGYDLSDYTWEEMYEEYLNEAKGNLPSAPDIGGALSRFGRYLVTPMKKTPTAAAEPASTPKPKPTDTDYKSPFAGSRDKAFAAAQKIKGSPVVGSKPIPSGGTGAAAASGATKPVIPSKLTPSSSGPAIGTTKGGTKFERRAATSAELKAARAAGGGEAGIKAAVTRSQPTQGPSAAKVDPGSVARSMQAFKPVTPTAAAKAAPSTSPAASGSVVPASNAIAAKPSSAMSQGAIRNRRLNMEMEYDAYDVVLEYLLDNGHVDTVDEAHYVMLEMDAETIGTIVEAAADQSDKQIDKGVKATYKAQNVLDNQHQGRSKGLNKLPRGEREEKAERMQGRLKTRRDDLFGERNKREDSKRDKLKKMLGL